MWFSLTYFHKFTIWLSVDDLVNDVSQVAVVDFQEFDARALWPQLPDQYRNMYILLLQKKGKPRSPCIIDIDAYLPIIMYSDFAIR